MTAAAPSPARPRTHRWSALPRRRAVVPLPGVVRAAATTVRGLVLAPLFVATELVAIVVRPLSFVRRRDGLSGRRLRATSAWRARAHDVAPPGARWGGTPFVSSRRPPGRLTVGRVAALVAFLLFADVCAGVTLTALKGGPDRSSGRQVVLPPASVAPPPRSPIPPADNPVWKSKALAHVPWARDFFLELSTIGSDDQPYILFRNADHKGRYLNTRDGSRVSYESPAADADSPVIWFFGGSTMLGWAQRDDHTIASEVARLAEADGHPVRVVNDGVPGYVNFQEVMRFEQRLAVRPAPDMVVFYDGSNDVATGIIQPATDQPTLLNDPLNLGLRMQGELPAPDPIVDLQLLGEEVRRYSRWTIRPDSVRRAMRAYRRGLAIARDLADEHGVEMATFFQPVTTDDYLLDAARKALPPDVIDISQVLKEAPGKDTYIDVVHTNELGARIVAEEIYRHLRTRIAALDRDS
jgi:hypothetical protein